MVSGHKPGDLPDDPTEPRLHRRTITLEVSPETYDIWRRLHALAAEEHGQRLSDDELIPSLYRRAYADAPRASSPAYKLAIKQCPDCRRAWQYSGGRDVEIDPAVAECAACDAVHLGSLDAPVPERATTTVTPRKREQILARDGHACTVPGCRRNIGLDLHHIEYQSRGGGHEMSNITTTCDLHHKAIHLGKLVIRGAAPNHLSFEFRSPRDRHNATDDDAHVDAPRPPSLVLRRPRLPTLTTTSPAPPQLSSALILPDEPSAPRINKHAVQRAAPDPLAFELRSPRDRRNVTNDDAHVDAARPNHQPPTSPHRLRDSPRTQPAREAAATRPHATASTAADAARRRPRDRHAEHAAHERDHELANVCFDDGVLHDCPFAKYAVALFQKSRSCSTVRRSRCKRASSARSSVVSAPGVALLVDGRLLDPGPQCRLGQVELARHRADALS